MIVLLFSSCYYDNEEDLYPFYENNCDTTSVSYSLTVKPILERSCVSCHQASNPSGNVLLDTYDGVKAAADNGSLFGSINHDDGYTAMPLGGGKLSNCSIAQVKSWIDNGSLDN
jgi:hypothetical protein